MYYDAGLSDQPIYPLEPRLRVLLTYGQGESLGNCLAVLAQQGQGRPGIGYDFQVDVISVAGFGGPLINLDGRNLVFDIK